MFDAPTVLILGAGASMPYGFPSGRTLLFDIKDGLEKGLRHTRNGGDPDLAPEIYLTVKWFKFPDQRYKFSDQKIEDFTNALGKTMQPSIDAFLEMYPEYMDIGKVAIAASLIPLERKEVIVQRDRSDVQWYEYFFNLIRNPDQIRKGNLSVVTFNYDRSLEYFLYYSFMNSYHLDSAEAIELMKHIPIVHVYGDLGIPKFLNNDGRDYDSTVNVPSIMKSIEGLKIISEVDDSHTTLPIVNRIIDGAEKVIFIGFSFHPINVQRLKLHSKRVQYISGTVFNMMDGEINRVRTILADHNMPRNSELYKLDALNFLRETNYF